MSEMRKSETAVRYWRRTGIKLDIFLVAYAGVLFTGYILSLYLSTFTWRADDRLYPLLHFLNRYWVALAIIGAVLGMLGIVVWDYRKMYHLVQREVALAYRHADEAEQRKNDLVVYLAHDLKTPLTSVIGYLELLQTEPELPEKIRSRYTAVAADKAGRLEELINEFFEITRYNLTSITLEKSEINLTRMLEQIIFEFQPVLRERELVCDLDAPKDYPFVCDAGRLMRVFDNLLRNAVNYSFPATTIRIQMRPERGGVRLSFENEGNTIPPEKLNRIFEQFFRLDDARSTKNGGSGIGLAIAKEIVSLHGGWIRAYSENERIRFDVFLPETGEREQDFK